MVSAGAAAAALLLEPGLRPSLLIAAAAVPLMAARFFEPIYQVYERPWLSLWSNLVFAASLSAVAAYVALTPDIGLVTLIAAIALCHLVYLVVSGLLVTRLVKPVFEPRRDSLLAVLVIASPIGVGAIFTTITSRADVLLLEHLRGSAEAGLYSAAARFLDLGVMVAVTIVAPWIPILSAAIARERDEAIRQSRLFVQCAGILTLPVAILAPVLAHDVVTAAFGPSFAAAGGPLAVLGMNSS